VDATALTASALDQAIRAIVAGVAADAVLSVRIAGRLEDAHRAVLRASHLRTFVPTTMNVELKPDEARFVRRASPAAPSKGNGQLDLVDGDRER
jgi:hypothetical protein